VTGRAINDEINDDIDIDDDINDLKTSRRRR